MDKAPDLTPEIIKDRLREVTNNAPNLSSLPLLYAKFVRSSLQSIDYQARCRALNTIRNWSDYAANHQVDSSDLFMVRHHVNSFAEETFSTSSENVGLESVAIGDVTVNGVSCEEVLSTYINVAALHDEDVAVIGGVARLALKIHAGVDISAELPVNDLDVVARSSVNVSAKADAYGFDVTGAKVVNDEITDTLPGYITKFDCTMNQAAIHKGQLIYTPQSMVDIQQGHIRLTTRQDALFGSDALAMVDGNTYLLRSGFYRGLSFLFRGKGERLVVSQENIDCEKDNIGRYWLVMLYVKLLTMSDDSAKREAIGHWHDVARRIGSTETPNPEQFLQELADKYPMMRTYSSVGEGYDMQAQTRWIVGKMANRVVESMFVSPETDLPDTYTPADIMLSDRFPDFDYESFIRKTNTVFK